jgi:hypothetical protein
VASIRDAIISPIRSHTSERTARDPSGLSAAAVLLLERFPDQTKCGLRIGVEPNPQSAIINLQFDYTG